ncbi:hypothetical protein TNIN_181091 [Trichonephila inaurata madagascariensis]|uniref:Uncharacterized protein n=1 Tax=Trichonephila inaurata madagascariensis TaxID=2747483 RepID=A0A8X6XTM0_9ARAC|nr:hypothetical protein TNIN_181091 [Trichonephila inaurata madagascariensis]
MFHLEDRGVGLQIKAVPGVKLPPCLKDLGWWCRGLEDKQASISYNRVDNSQNCETLNLHDLSYEHPVSEFITAAPLNSK